MRSIARAVLGLFLVEAAFPGHALPTGAEISAGSGVLSQSGGVLAIQQTTPRLAINWQSFGVGAGESVVFRQPDASAIALNRVLGQDPSAILGRLSANGQVFVLNPNGVLFGPGAQVDVGGIVASTLGLSDADFLAGRYTFAGGGAGTVINRGAIRAAEGGYVALLGPQVVNEGVIAARLGTVALGAGNQVTLQLAGNALVGFSVDQAAVDALVANRQLIRADGGTVILSARARDALLATVVNNEGIVEARSVSVQNGVIRLEGGASGVVAVGGRLDATGANTGETGGSVAITGDKVALANGAVVDASGHAGGGTLRVGGDYQGQNPDLRNASRTYVGPDATLRADATAQGDGGKVIVWANDATQFYGAISARGGSAGGNGGFVETSGKVTLESTGSVDGSAASGRPGQWLLDPNNITIQTAGVNTNVTAGPNFTTTNDNAIVTTGSIVSALNAGTSVTLTTGSAGANTQAGNITVANAIAKTAGGSATLTLTAINNIVFNAGANVGSTSNQLNLSLNAGGSITSPASINTNGGVLTFNAAGASTQSGVISGAGSVVKIGAGTLTLSGANTYTGPTAINGGVLIVNADNRLGAAPGAATANKLTFNGGTLQSTATFTLNANRGITFNAGGGTISTNPGTTLTYGGIASGTGPLTKAGAGTLVLSGSNTYTGATAINAGTLRLGAANRIADASAVTVGTGATFNLAGFAETVGSIAGAGNITLGAGTLTAGGNNTSTTFSGVASGTGGLTKAGTGTLTLSGVNTYTGATTINAGTLRVAGGSAIADSSAIVLANVAGASLDLNGTNETIGSLAGGGATGGNLTLGAGTLTTGGNNTTTTFSGVASGTGGITKVGTGTFTLTGTNTHGGLTRVYAGTLTAQNAGALGATGVGRGTVVASGATLNINNVAIGAELLTLNGTGVGGAGALTGTGAGASVAGTVTLATDSAVGAGAGAALTLSGVVAGAGALTKVGAGRVVLTGANTYAGATNVNAGVLRVGGGNAIPNASPVTLANVAGAALDLNGTSETIGSLAGGGATGGNVTLGAGTLTAGGNNASTTFGGVASGTGGISKAGTGTFTLARANTYSGTTLVSAGTLAHGVSNALAGGAVTVSGGTWNLDTFSDTVGAVTLTGGSITGSTGVLTGSAYAVQSGTIGVNLAGAGALTKTTGGTVVLSGTNTYTGATNVNAGTLRLANGNAIANTSPVVLANAAGAVLDLNGTSETIGNLSGGGAAGGNVTLGAGTLTVNQTGTTTYAGVIAGTAGLTKAGAGTFTLTGANTYTGPTQINAGTLRLGAANRIADASTVTIAAGATFNLNNNAETVGSVGGAGNIALGSATLTTGGANTSTSFSGVVSGTGGLVKQGSGTFTLAGTNTYTGATTVSGGTLQVANSSALGSTAAGTSIGSNARLIVDGVALGAEPVTLNGSGLSGTGAITSDGVASLAGPITLAADSMIAPSAGSTLTLAGPVNGAFGLTTGGAGTLDLNGTVGGVTPLAFLTTAATGATGINAGLVRTSGSQTYNNPTTLGTGVTLQSTGGNLTAAAPVTATAGALSLSAAGNVDFANAANDFDTVGVAAGGNATLRDANALALGASSVGSLTATAGAGVTLNGTVAATGAGSSIVLAGSTFTNNAGATALDPGAGRWLVYSTDPAADTFGGLASGNQALWNRTYPGVVTETGNRYVFAIQPTLTFTSTDVAKTYGQDATAAVAGAFVVTGFVDAAAYGGVFTQDTAANTYSGAPAVTSVGSPATAPVAGSPYPIAIDVTGITPTTGYAKAAASPGQLKVNAAALTITADNQSKVYGNADPLLTATFTGLQNGETPAIVSGLLLFAPTGAAATATGSPHPITASGATAANYTISYVDGLLTVTPRPLSITADAQTKVYGQPDPALTYAIGGAGVVYGDVLAGALTRVAGETVARGPYAILQGTLTNAANPNYDIAYSGSVLAITPATLTYLAHPATVVQGTPFPPFTGTVQGFQGTDTQANATTGTLTFGTTAANGSPAGTYPIDGSGLVANFGNYVFVQAPSNATALTIEPRGNPIPPVELPQVYTGALASAAQSESTCAELQDAGQAETLCGAQQNFRSSEQVNLVPGWRRVIELGRTSLTVEGEGMRTP